MGNWQFMVCDYTHFPHKVVVAMDSGIILKSFIDVTALLRRLNSSYMINPTFILNPLIYLHV